MNSNTNISEEELDLIERYILNNMSQQEHDVFTLRLSTEDDLQSKVSEVRLLFLGVQEAILQEKVNLFHQELPASNTQTSGKISSLKRWLVAASVILFVATGVWLFLSQPGKEEKIFSKYYKPDPGLISAMSTSDNYVFDRAMIDYKTGNYDSAINAWQGLLKTKPGNDTLNYFIGSSYLALEKGDKAMIYFKKVIGAANSYFLNDAYWYAGLALLKEGKTKEAIPFIEKSGHEQKNELLNKLGQ